MILTFYLILLKEWDSLDPLEPTVRLAWFPEYRRELLESRENLEKAENLFQALEKDNNFYCLVPQKLYYKVVKEGEGASGAESPLVALDYTIFSPLGHCIESREKVFLNLRNTISGFSHGVKGMKKGKQESFLSILVWPMDRLLLLKNASI